MFVLDVKKTEKRIKELIATGWYLKCRIKNRYYYTDGYALPIAEFKSCIVKLNRMSKQQRALKQLEWSLMK